MTNEDFRYCTYKFTFGTLECQVSGVSPTDAAELFLNLSQDAFRDIDKFNREMFDKNMDQLNKTHKHCMEMLEENYTRMDRLREEIQAECEAERMLEKQKLEVHP